MQSIERRGKRWKRPQAAILGALTAITLSGCLHGPSGSLDGLCAGLERPIQDHAAALVVDGGPISRDTGRRLIAGIDAGCLP